MSDIHFFYGTYIADTWATAELLLGLICYMMNMRNSGNPRVHESDDYIFLSTETKLIVSFFLNGY